MSKGTCFNVFFYIICKTYVAHVSDQFRAVEGENPSLKASVLPLHPRFVGKSERFKYLSLLWLFPYVRNLKWLIGKLIYDKYVWNLPPRMNHHAVRSRVPNSALCWPAPVKRGFCGRNVVVRLCRRRRLYAGTKTKRRIRSIHRFVSSAIRLRVVTTLKKRNDGHYYFVVEKNN